MQRVSCAASHLEQTPQLQKQCREKLAASAAHASPMQAHLLLRAGRQGLHLLRVQAGGRLCKRRLVGLARALPLADLR